jgi:uncharacterized protein
MKSRIRLYIVFLTVLCIGLAPLLSFAEVSIPAKPLNHVVDLAGIIDANMETGLNRYLLELEQKTTAQMVILTINSLEGESIDDLSLRIAHDKWKLGQKGKDNGVLLLVSLKDRKYRFETGYGLEGTLPDSLVGITAAALVVINTIAGDAGVEIAGMPKLRTRSGSPYNGRKRREPTLLGKVLGVLFFIGMIYMFIKHPRLFMLFLMMNMLGGGRRSGWGGGGGFGGGSFGGGGGGGFGGGGASGGW